MRILVVDDDENLREVLSAVLSREGVEVDSAHDGAEALVFLDHQQYDLILSDLRMPELDGPRLYEALRTRYRFRTRYSTSLPRVIFMTGNAALAEYAEFLRGTTEPILEKPFNLKVVRQVVSVLLGGLRGAVDSPSDEPVQDKRELAGPLLTPLPARSSGPVLSAALPRAARSGQRPTEA